MKNEVTEIRLSLIWAEATLDAFKPAGGGAHLAFLSETPRFKKEFERACREPVLVQNLSLRPPWPKPSGQRFWRSYLGQQSLDRLSGKDAWEALVPFRAKVPYPISALAGGSILLEAFFYPHGLALLATIRLMGQFTLESAAEEALKIRRSRAFEIELQPGETRKLMLEEIADEVFTRLRDFAWGNGSAGRRTALDPFTIFTVIKGTCDRPPGPILTDPAHQRALEAVTNWRTILETDPLPPVDTVLLTSHRPPVPGTRLVYGSKRGRALWFPEFFTGPTGGSAVACYHRNLTFASMQVESLCGFAREAAGQLANNKVFAYEENECVRHTAGLLGRLYGGNSSVYRSWSVRAQIKQNDFVPDIDAIRGSCRMQPLA